MGPQRRLPGRRPGRRRAGRAPRRGGRARAGRGSLSARTRRDVREMASCGASSPARLTVRLAGPCLRIRGGGGGGEGLGEARRQGRRRASAAARARRAGRSLARCAPPTARAWRDPRAAILNPHLVGHGRGRAGHLGRKSGLKVAHRRPERGRGGRPREQHVGRRAGVAGHHHDAARHGGGLKVLGRGGTLALGRGGRGRCVGRGQGVSREGPGTRGARMQQLRAGRARAWASACTRPSYPAAAAARAAARARRTLRGVPRPL